MRLKIKGCNEKYLVALLDILHKHYNVRVRYEKPSLSRTFELEIEGSDEEIFTREVQAFCSQVGWRTERI